METKSRMPHTRNMFIYFLGKLVPAISSLVIMFVGLRYLGKSEYGKYNLIMNTAVIVSTFSVGWIQQSILRFNSGVSESVAERKAAFDRLASIASYGALIVMFLISAIYFKLSLTQCAVIALFTYTFSVFSVILSQHQSQFKSVLYALSESVYYLVTIAISLLLILVLNFSDFHVFFIAMLAGGAIIVLAYKPAFILLPLMHSRAKNGKEFFRKMFEYGFPITIWLFISGLFNVADRFIIREFFDYKAVGTYSSVYDLVYKICGFACLPVMLAVHPAIVKAWNNHEREHAKALIKKALLLETAILIIIATGLTLFNNIIFNTIFKLDEVNLLPWLLPLILSGMLWQMALFVHKPLELHFMQRHMIIGITISIVSNIILNLIFVPKYGYYAAAYATLLSTIIYMVYVLLIAGKKTA